MADETADVGTRPDASDALRRASALGPFFEVDLIPRGEDWQPFSALVEPNGSLLRAQVAGSRATLSLRSGTPLDAIEERVAASLWFLGWSARLVAPWLGATILAGLVPLVPAGQLRWQRSAGQPVPLGVTTPAGRAVDVAASPSVAAEAVYDECIRALVQPLLSVVAEAFSLSGQVLWGNVASAVAGSAAMLARAAPTHADLAQKLTSRLLETDALRDRSALRDGRFVRQSCCLFYRVPGAGLCADCVLA